MYSIKTIIFIFILFQTFIIESLLLSEGTLTIDYGRISNIPNDQIYVAAVLTQADCIRQCVDFSKNHQEYMGEDCFAYNYQFDQFTCELIYSTQPLDYVISFETRWKTGLKY